MANLSVNSILSSTIPWYDTQGTILCIINVVMWYAPGFGRILIDNIDLQSNRVKNHKCTNIYQAVDDLHK